LRVRAEIDRRTVQRVEAGTANPGIEAICRLRAALGASWEEIAHGLRKSASD
jgi:transcriptional regulator with XRE-family HTH domain